MAPAEIILSGSSAEASSSASSTARLTSAPAIQAHDLLSGSHLHSFKTSTAASSSTAYVQTQHGVGGALFAVQDGKALLNVWAWSKDQLHMKIHLPERLSAFSVSPDGLWAAGGSPTGQLYLWEVSSGLLLATFPAHYRSISTLRFTADSAVLLSGSLDSAVHVYLVSRLVSDDAEDGGIVGKPYGTLRDHTLAITAVEVGRTAGSHGGRCWTASEDGTVKVWSLHPPFALLTTFALPPSTTPSTIAIDPTERYFYVGTTSGNVHHVPLYRHRAGLARDDPEFDSAASGVADVEAVGGGGQGSSAIKVSPSLISVKSPITALTLSLSLTHLLIGTQSGDIHLHSLPSHQHLRTLSTHSGPITHLATLLRPPDMLGAAGPGARAHGPGTKGGDWQWPIMDIKPFERVRAGPAAREAREVGVVVSHQAPEWARRAELFDRLRGGFGSGGAGVEGPRSRSLPPGVYMPGAPLAGVSSEGGAGARVEELERENKKLRASLERAVRVNDKIWAGVVQMRLAETDTS